ncbi:MAG TPA: GNAT family N-acetyltransferase [Thermomicrobiales bacterium]|nr:GNAT family N-acetyltransferase [Thermomicrobiales bacterium]
MTVPELSQEQQDSPIRQLTPGDARALRIPWDSRHSVDEIERIADREPRLSIWNARTGEFLIGGFWRHRSEIATMHQLAATGGAIDLVQHFASHCAARGIRMIVASEQAERRKHQFYESAGLSPVEDIIVYEMSRIRAKPHVAGNLRFVPVASLDAVTLDELLEIDHEAFPWLWWNSKDEFVEYSGAPGVGIHVGRDHEDRVMAYVGITRYRSWGHLDRIAVRPDAQGTGLGRAALDYAVMTLAGSGARRVGLSTQARNTRSRRLYEAYGFRRSPSHDYRIFGRHLTGEPELHREG